MSVVAEYLKLRGVPFEVIPHTRAFTSHTEAVAVGAPADEVLKTLVIDAGGSHALVVVPGSHRVDMRLVRKAVGDHDAHLASEWELENHFCGYELGAMPPLGSLVGAHAYVDPEVFLHETVVFADGLRTESIRCRTADLFRAEPVTVVPLTEAVRDQKELIGS
jgi:prolyl-tRNA editing enzyme YbaK/EbsC (Cys-tRNA(Pro) deacylase)